jgi:hypothetical protein
MQEARFKKISADFFNINDFNQTRIDDFVKNQKMDRVDLIKMDIEGSEPEALIGATETIKTHRPVLAISAYRKREHLISLMSIISQILPSYKFGFAQHSPVVWEAVLYGWCEGNRSPPMRGGTEAEA